MNVGIISTSKIHRKKNTNLMNRIKKEPVFDPELHKLEEGNTLYCYSNEGFIVPPMTINCNLVYFQAVNDRAALRKVALWRQGRKQLFNF